MIGRIIGWIVDTLLYITMSAIFLSAVVIYLGETELVVFPWGKFASDSLEVANVVLAGVVAVIMMRVMGLRRAEAAWQRRNNTLQLLLEMRRNEQLGWHSRSLLHHYPSGEEIDPDEIEELYEERSDWQRIVPSARDRDVAPTLESVFYIANYYEFSCAAIEKNVLDEKLIIETIAPIMYNFYYKVCPVLKEAQRRALEKSPKHKLYKSYEGMIGKWERSKQHFIRR